MNCELDKGENIVFSVEFQQQMLVSCVLVMNLVSTETL